MTKKILRRGIGRRFYLQATHFPANQPGNQGMSLKALEENKTKLAGEIRRLAEVANKENRDFTAEEKVNWEKVNSDYDANERQLEIARRADAVKPEERTIVPGRQDQIGDPNPTKPLPVNDETRNLALNAWFRTQAGEDPTDEQISACKQLGLNARTRELQIPLYADADRRDLQRKLRESHERRHSDLVYESRAGLSAFSPTSSLLVPPVNFVRQLEINMLAFGGMEQVAEIITTAGGEPMEWPTADDTSNTGVQLAEATTIGSSVDPSFTKVIFYAHKFSSKAVLVSSELLQDSAFDIAGMIGGMLGERLSRVSNTKFTTGTGNGGPKGITNCSSVGVTTASGTAITADEVLGLVHSIDPAYRNGGRFMFHDNILLYLRKLKDGEGRYLWQQGMGSAPDTLWSYPYTINQDMQSSVATGTKTMLFGQLSKYKIRRAGGVRFRRLDERYADTDQVAFIAFLRQDGNLVSAGTAPVKHLLQA